MSHQTAFWLALAIMLFFGMDAVFHDWAWSFVLIENGLVFMNWAMFWR